MSPLRILLTASREWTDRDAIRAVLLDVLTLSTIGIPTLVHGACPDGGDQIADEIWTEWMQLRPGALRIERYRGRDFPSFRARNQHMVDRGATHCTAFATSWASGTGQTARMARKAGIHTVDYGVDTSNAARAVAFRG